MGTNQKGFATCSRSSNFRDPKSCYSRICRSPKRKTGIVSIDTGTSEGFRAMPAYVRFTSQQLTYAVQLEMPAKCQ
jgi:hypothetical protein